MKHKSQAKRSDTRGMSFYLSDIRLRGGGGSAAAQNPVDIRDGRDATTELDSVDKCRRFLDGGVPYCNKRLARCLSCHVMLCYVILCQVSLASCAARDLPRNIVW